METSPPRPTTDHTSFAYQQSAAQRRNRRVLSCGHCRIRKLRCNRKSPCDSCCKTGDASTCLYPAHTSRKSDQVPMIRRRKDELETRINRLENLLTSVAAADSPIVQSNSSPARSFTDSSNHQVRGGTNQIDQITQALGVMKVNEKEDTSIYLGSVHWVSVMSEIEEFRAYLLQHHEQLEHDAIENRSLSLEQSENTPLSLLRPSSTPMTTDEILSHIPERNIVGQLVLRFFDSSSPSSCIIHEPTFRKELAEFWDSPTKTKTIWLGLLFAIMHLAQQSFEAEQPLIHQNSSTRYRQLTIQCLLASNYANPTKYTIETLMLHSEAEWMESQDAIIEISLVLGMTIRLAMRMGLHRDSKSHPELSPFQGEMRRRIWATLHSVDIIYSFQISLPCNINPSDCDCTLPRNLKDTDFDEKAKDLPASRSDADITAISYPLAKYRLLLVVGRIMTMMDSTKVPSREDVDLMENSLHNARQLVPHHLQINNSSMEPGTAPLGLFQQRISLDRIYQLANCILYRKFLSKSPQDPRLAHYNRVCVDAAMALLHHQKMLYVHCASTYPQPFLHRYILSITMHDFFVAGMTVALKLHYELESEDAARREFVVNPEALQWQSQMISALETASDFWKIFRDQSVEAAKAYGIFTYIVTRAKKVLNSAEQGPMIENNNPSDEDIPRDTIVQLDADQLAGGPDFDMDFWNSYQNDFDSFIHWPPTGSQ